MPRSRPPKPDAAHAVFPEGDPNVTPEFLATGSCPRLLPVLVTDCRFGDEQNQPPDR
jgi:hypothetical protein